MDNKNENEDEPAHQLTPFERLVLQRFDQIDERLQKLEAKALDTKPIWEQALVGIVEVKREIVEVKNRLHKVERAIGILAEDVVQVRADLRGFDERITALEGRK